MHPFHWNSFSLILTHFHTFPTNVYVVVVYVNKILSHVDLCCCCCYWQFYLSLLGNIFFFFWCNFMQNIYHIDVYSTSSRTTNWFDFVTLTILSVQKYSNHYSIHIKCWLHTQIDTQIDVKHVQYQKILLHNHRYQKNASSYFYFTYIEVWFSIPFPFGKSSFVW